MRGNETHKIFTVIDLELHQPSTAILMVGAVTGNIETGEILETLEKYVDAKEPVSEYIHKLTGISDNDVITKGVSLMQAFQDLKKMHLSHGAHRSLVQWGTGDESKLKADLTTAGMGKDEWIFGFRNFDVKTIYQAYCLANGMKMQSGLANSMRRLGLKMPPNERFHNAKSDSIGTFIVFHELLKRIRQ